MGVTATQGALHSPAFNESLSQSPQGKSSEKTDPYYIPAHFLEESSSSTVIFSTTHQALLCCQCWISAQRFPLQLLAGFSSLCSALGNFQDETQNWVVLVHYQQRSGMTSWCSLMPGKFQVSHSYFFLVDRCKARITVCLLFFLHIRKPQITKLSLRGSITFPSLV